MNLQLAQKKLVGNASFDWVITQMAAPLKDAKTEAQQPVTKGPMTSPRTIKLLLSPAGEHCSSYQCEMVAIKLALTWLAEDPSSWERAEIVGDSKSAYRAWQD